MSEMKRHVEAASEALGLDGGINHIALGYAQHALDLQAVCLSEPLTVEQMQEQSTANAEANTNPGIEGVVCLSLDELTDILGFSALDDVLNEKLAGTRSLTGIRYALIGVDIAEDMLYFRVSGYEH